MLSGCGDDPRVVLRCPGAAPRTVHVEVARTAEARRRGLMGRSGLAPGTGLLLAFPTEDEVCVRNAGVPFAIDALFARESGELSAVHRFGPDEDVARCALARTVLEVAAGALPGAGEGCVLERVELALPAAL
ncbi:MAG: DUF192 domain-containing protein [Myxococcota bacterium]